MWGSPLKLSFRFGWKTEEPCEQTEVFEEKLIFSYYYLTNGILCGE